MCNVCGCQARIKKTIADVLVDELKTVLASDEISMIIDRLHEECCDVRKSKSQR